MQYLAPKIALFRQDLRYCQKISLLENLTGPTGPAGPTGPLPPLTFLEAFSKLDLDRLPWETATVAQAQSTNYLDTQLRNNSKIAISAAICAELTGLEQILLQIGYQNLFEYDPNLRLTNFGYDLLRYGVGQHFHQHADLIPGHPIFGKRAISLLAYLNDDYQGGELFFPNQNLTFKPHAGDIILFPSGLEYPHASLDVTKGTKYVAVSWFYRI